MGIIHRLLFLIKHQVEPLSTFRWYLFSIRRQKLALAIGPN
jgi:hypothetical protein